MSCFVFLWKAFTNSLPIRGFVRLIQFLYIRWRVFLTVYTDVDPEADSLASSQGETPKRRIIRTNSVYPPLFLQSCDGPGCIDVYNQFMNYGSIDVAKPGTLIKSVSDYSKFSPKFCQISSEWSARSSFICESTSSWNTVIHKPEDAGESSEVLDELEIEIEEGDSTLKLYHQWIASGLTQQDEDRESESSRRFIQTPVYVDDQNSYIYDEENQHLYSHVPQREPETFEYFLQIATQGAQTPTYPEVQRQIQNYFFTKPRYIEKVTSLPVIAERSRFPLSPISEYQTASVSTPVGKQMVDRFSERYWKITGNDCAERSERWRMPDSYHNRFFGKGGYQQTRRSIRKVMNGEDTMPEVEREALRRERMTWERLNRFGGAYNYMDPMLPIPVPDTNGLYTSHWEKEYEHQIDPHTSIEWRLPKRYAARYSDLF